MIISRSPFRVSFFGGGTDFPEYFNEHGGAVLATAINKYCYISIHELSPFFKYRFRASYAQTECVQQPEKFKHPLIRECLLELGIQSGLEISHVSDLPGRTGLGTSSSFTVGLLNVLHTFRGDTVDAKQLSEEAIHIERRRVGDPGGHQDQYLAAYGGLQRVDFSAEGTTVKAVELPSGRMQQLENHLMMLYTGLEMSAAAILKEQQKRTKMNGAALARMRGLVDEAETLLTGTDDIDLFGDLLHETWTLKRGLSAGISNDHVNEAYNTARSLGARGGKLLGAGGRGFLLIYADPKHHADIEARLKGLRRVPFGFSPSGSEIIFRA